MSFLPIHQEGINLQATIAAATSGVGDTITPHHPITDASSSLWFDEDGTLSCEHASVPPNDPRTQSCINHSVVLLLLEPAMMNNEWSYKTPDQLSYEWEEKWGEKWN